MSTALRSVGLLDVVSTTSPGPSVARLVSTPVSTASRRTLVRNAGERRNGNGLLGGIPRNSPSMLSAHGSRKPQMRDQENRASAAFQFTFRKNAAM